MVSVFGNIMEVKWTFGFMKIKMILHFHKSVWHLHFLASKGHSFPQPAQAIFDDPGVDGAASSKYRSAIGTAWSGGSLSGSEGVCSEFGSRYQPVVASWAAVGLLQGHLPRNDSLRNR